MRTPPDERALLTSRAEPSLAAEADAIREQMDFGCYYNPDENQIRGGFWDEDPDKARQSGEVARGIAAAVPLAPRSRVLEYGAGTGLVTIALLEELIEPSLTLADNSSGMRQVLADKVEAG